MPPEDSDSYVVILPVKPPGRGKSRLVGLPEEQRTALASAFALDTASAALGTPLVMAVLAVTDDHVFASRLAGLGCAVIPDGVSGDLNGSLLQAAAEAGRRWPHARPAALLADLPALTPQALDAALAAARDEPSAFVRDASGTGTTLYTASTDEFLPKFGPGSAERHAAGGARELTADARLRRDVDDIADLSAAMVLGVGEHTAAASGRA